MLLSDIEPTTQNNGSKPDSLSCCNGSELYFAADNGVRGNELWKWTASTGAVLVRDIQPGAASSPPEDFECCNGIVYFTAATAAGRELWRTNGTSAGTVIVRDIRPGAAGSNPANLTACGTTLFFTANDGLTGPELRQSDGTKAGTGLVRDIPPRQVGSLPGPSPSRPGWRATQRPAACTSSGRWQAAHTRSQRSPMRRTQAGNSSSNTWSSLPQAGQRTSHTRWLEA